MKTLDTIFTDNKLLACGSQQINLHRNSATASTQSLANMDGPMTVGIAEVINCFGFSIAGVSPSQRNCVDAPDDGAAWKRILSLKLSERVSHVRQNFARCFFFFGQLSSFSFSRLFSLSRWEATHTVKAFNQNKEKNL